MSPMPERRWFTTDEVARRFDVEVETVREWCRQWRIHASKTLSGRGLSAEWRISWDEILRIEREGLLPPEGGGE